MKIFFLLLSLGFSHVGNPSIVYEGNAGEYPLRVVIRPPGVVPGLAKIYILSLDKKITSVKTQPMKWDAGVEGSPPPDIAKQMFDQPDKFNSELWLMDFGSYSINVEVDGKNGIANIVVPVMSIATKKSDMSPVMKGILILLMLLLLVGFVTIIGASIEESTLTPGDKPDDNRIRKAKICMVFTFIFCVGIIFGGKKWWDGIADIYYTSLFKPMDTQTQLFSYKAHNILNLEITDPMWKSGGYAPIIPDHDKLIHSYFIKDDLSVFGHAHPILNKKNSDQFELVFPNDLPFGKYLIYSDITHETGFNQTLLDTIILKNIEYNKMNELPNIDPDNSWLTIKIGKEYLNNEYEFDNGSKLIWLNFRSQFDLGLVNMEFLLLDNNENPLPLEPYIEMGGHGIIYKKDGSQFVHIHPTGNFSMASQEVLFELKEGVEVNQQELFCTFGYRNENGNLVENLVDDGRVAFPPFEFSEPGEYRIWIQVKSAGNVKTGIFDLIINQPNA